MNIKNILTEAILKEVAIDGDTINSGYYILISQNNSYVLYDYAYQQIIAYAKINTFKSGYITIENVAADKGYGPAIHDIVLMDNYPYQVICDEELTDASIKIWDYYFSKRTDVQKSRIPHQLLSDTLLGYDNESLLYSYSLAPKNWFKNLEVKSDMIIQKYNLNTLDIIKKGEYFFNQKYGEYFV